jgi:hypothetical protein
MEDCLQTIRKLLSNLSDIERSLRNVSELPVEDLFDCEYHLSAINKSVQHLSKLFGRNSTIISNIAAQDHYGFDIAVKDLEVDSMQSKSNSNVKKDINNTTAGSSAQDVADDDSDATDDYNIGEDWTIDEPVEVKQVCCDYVVARMKLTCYDVLFYCYHVQEPNVNARLSVSFTSRSDEFETTVDDFNDDICEDELQVVIEIKPTNFVPFIAPEFDKLICCVFFLMQLSYYKKIVVE